MTILRHIIQWCGAAILSLLVLCTCAPQSASALNLGEILTQAMLNDPQAAEKLRNNFIVKNKDYGFILTVRGRGMTYANLSVIGQVNSLIHLGGFDFSNNSLTSFDKLSFQNAPWAQPQNGGSIAYIDLSYNNLDGAGVALLGNGSPEAPDGTCDSGPGAPFMGGLGSPFANNCPFTVWIKSTLRYLDLSGNPRIKTLPALFGSSALWFYNQQQDPKLLPTFKCAACGLTGVTNNTFQQTFLTVDLSQNDFSNSAKVNWAFTFNSAAFGFTSTLNLSHCALTTVPGINVAVQSQPPSSFSADYTSYIDLSYNAFNSTTGTAQNPMFSFTFAGGFDGTLDLSHSDMKVLRTWMFGGKIGNINLAYNNFGAELNAQGLSASTKPSTGNAPVGATGNIWLNDAGITQINQTMFQQAQAYLVDLSGNYFPTASSLNGAFDGLSVTKLVLNRCNMTAATLAGTTQTPFINAVIANLTMTNDGSDPTEAHFNRFDPLPSEWLTNENTRFADNLQTLIVGEVVNVAPAFFHFVNMQNESTSWVNNASPVMSLTLYMQNGTALWAEHGPLFHLMTGYYGKAPYSPRAAFALTIMGSNFLDVSINGTASVQDAQDVFHAESITMPLDPANLHPEMFARFPSFPAVTYTQPTSYYRAIGNPPWSPLLSSASMASDLLSSASGVVSFAISMDPTVTYSPVTVLPEDFFQAVIPFSGFGALTVVDLGYSNLRSYPQFLFAGLYRAGTTITVNMTLLYDGDVPIPPGLFDDIPESSTAIKAGQTLTGRAKINKVRNCGYFVNQKCSTKDCPDGSYLSSRSSFYYCALCTAGNACIQGQSIPCGKGSYQPSKNSSACVLCPAGTYNPSLGQKESYSCLACHAGKSNMYSGATSSDNCTTCSNGTYSAIQGSSSCSSCEPGTYMSASRQSCTSCPSGRWSASRNASSVADCHDCAPGLTSATGSISSASCVEATCISGTYFDSRGGGIDGGYCFTCTAGFSCSSNRQTQCSVGEWSAAGADRCELCAAGKFNSATQQTSVDSCTECPAATYNDRTGQASCTSCPLNTYSSSIGSTNSSSCLPCSNPLICTQATASPVDITVLSDSATGFLTSVGTAAVSRAAYAPVRGGTSLRLAVDPDDATLLELKAGTVPIGSSSVSHSDFDPTGDSVDSSAMYALLLSLVLSAGISILIYRLLPPFVVLRFDTMASAHRLQEGGIMVKRPTQWGAAWTIAFVFIAIYVGIALGTSSNATLVNSLQPASANADTGSATGAFQLTVKTYGAEKSGTGALALPQWCTAKTVGYSVTGFTGSYTIAAAIDGAACVIKIDCLACGVSSIGEFGITVPYVNQLWEWEIFVTSAVPGSWSRFFGVIAQEQGRLLDASAYLKFSAIEAYFLDKRTRSSITYCPKQEASAELSVTGVTCSLPTSSSGSGFELAFSSYNTVIEQPPSSLTSASTVNVAFRFEKQDVSYMTTVTAKLTVFQILSSILATVVSLLSVFALFFAFSEQALRRMKITAGPVPVDIHVISQAEIEAEERQAARQREKLGHMADEAFKAANKAAHSVIDAVQEAMPGSARRHHVTAASTGGGSVEMADPKRVTIEQMETDDAGEEKKLDTAYNSTDTPKPVAGRTSSIHPAVQSLLVESNRGTSAADGAAASALARELAEMRTAAAEEQRRTQQLLKRMQDQLEALQQQQQQPTARSELIASPSGIKPSHLRYEPTDSDPNELPGSTTL